MIKTIYILIGPQGSGKTHWAKGLLCAHSDCDVIANCDKLPVVRISQDEQGKSGHLMLFHQYIKIGVSMVIDRINLDHRQRQRYVSCARDNGYHIVFVWFQINRSTCLDRLAKRKDHPSIKKDDDHNAIIDSYFYGFEPPTIEEYDELLIITEKKRPNILDLRNTCGKRHVIVVGDIHGCFDEFMELLNKCSYTPEDIVVSVGDLVDHGPKIKETLAWFYNTPRAYSVEGNHDDRAKRYWRGNPVKKEHGLINTIEQVGDPFSSNTSGLSSWIGLWPRIIRLPDIKDALHYKNTPTYVVHAGVEGWKTIQDQRSSVCLYARYLRGKDFFDSEKGILWWTTLDGNYTIINGHIRTNNFHPCDNAYCLDGGASKGGKLRALILDNGKCQICEVDSLS